jgi:hypothetical protein
VQMRLSCQGGPDSHARRSNPYSPQGILHPDKDSGWSTSGFPASLRYIRLYLIFALYELSSALSLGKALLVHALKRKRTHTPQARYIALQMPTRILAKPALSEICKCDSHHRNYVPFGKPPALPHHSTRQHEAAFPRTYTSMATPKTTRHTIPGPGIAGASDAARLFDQASCVRRASSSGATTSGAGFPLLVSQFQLLER